MNNQECIDLDIELATLLGYSGFDIEKHPFKDILCASKGDNITWIAVPRWSIDNAEAMKLVVEYELDVAWYIEEVGVWDSLNEFSSLVLKFKDFKDKYECFRVAVILSTIKMLKKKVGK